MLLVPVALVVAAAWSDRRYADLQRRGERASGTVLGLVPGSDDEAVRLEVQVRDRVVGIRMPRSTHGNAFLRGDTVTVVFRPTRPDRAVLAEAHRPAMLPAAAVMAGVFALFFLIVIVSVQ